MPPTGQYDAPGQYIRECVLPVNFHWRWLDIMLVGDHTDSKNIWRLMKVDERYKKVIEWFEQSMPVAQTELHYENPYQLLVAVILSAQCTDKRINMITPALFEAYPTPQSMAAASVDDIYHYIKSVSYPNNKAKNLKGMAMTLTERFNGEVPENMDDLLTIPGVGRKTANVILSVVFGKAAMAVDTHVFRVSQDKSPCR